VRELYNLHGGQKPVVVGWLHVEAELVWSVWQDGVGRGIVGPVNRQVVGGGMESMAGVSGLVVVGVLAMPVVAGVLAAPVAAPVAAVVQVAAGLALPQFLLCYGLGLAEPAWSKWYSERCPSKSVWLPLEGDQWRRLTDFPLG